MLLADAHTPGIRSEQLGQTMIRGTLLRGASPSPLQVQSSGNSQNLVTRASVWVSGRSPPSP